jgi:hypothetical protein
VAQCPGFARRLVPSRPIEIVNTDLPRNDFSQLFRTIHNQTELSSYYGEVERIFPFASGTSFHERIFPDNSLDLAFSATASHYISKIPGTISDHVHMVGARGAERQAYEELGRREWLLLALGQPSWRPAACSCSSLSHRRAGSLSRYTGGAACSTRSAAFGASLPMRA